MNGPAVLLCVAAVLFLLGQIRLGCSAEYNADGPKAWVHAGTFRIQVYPMKPLGKPKEKKKKAKQKKQEPQEPAAEEKPSVPVTEKIGGALAYVQELLPIALEGLGQFRRKLRVDVLKLELISGASDPADAALRYGQASAALGALWYPLVEALDVRDGHARVIPDFESGEMTVYAFLKLSLKLGQILWLGIYFGIRGLRAFLAVRRQQKEERKAV